MDQASIIWSLVLEVGLTRLLLRPGGGVAPGSAKVWLMGSCDRT